MMFNTSDSKSLRYFKPLTFVFFILTEQKPLSVCSEEKFPINLSVIVVVGYLHGLATLD